MSTPLIWIVIPIGFAGVLALLHNKPKLSSILTCVFTLGLVVLALVFPKDLAFVLPDQRIEIPSSLVILNRTVQITGESLTMIALLYAITLLWNLGNSVFKVSTWFNALSLVITALWVTVLSVIPFLYAALLIELIALLSVPLLSPRGKKTDLGLLRYIVFETLALALILLTGWMLSGISAVPAASPLLVRASIMLLFGFALWIGAFPFHSWIPMISQSSAPWAVSFLLAIMQTALSVFLLTFLDQYAWLRNLPQVYTSLRWLGVIMITFSGLAATLQQNLARHFGYLIIMETGYSLLAISLTPQGGLPYLAMLLLPRVFCYFLWGWALSGIRQLQPEANFEQSSLSGLYRTFPLLSMSILVSMLSLLGFPLLPLFPQKQMLWLLASRNAPETIPFIIIGGLGMLVAILHLFSLFIRNAGNNISPTTQKEPAKLVVPIILVLILMLTIAIAPQVILPSIMEILEPFTHLSMP
ncbi:MAG TPA: proton-conducting transporter membrane subunit [Anaerolineaceae bacterium]|nr:proton-conducting transporter membrane subunit [Anaerolineaceae bacterium]